MKKLSQAELLSVSNFTLPLQARAQENQDKAVVRADRPSWCKYQANVCFPNPYKQPRVPTAAVNSMKRAAPAPPQGPGDTKWFR